MEMPGRITAEETALYPGENSAGMEAWNILNDTVAVRRAEGGVPWEIPRGMAWFFGAEELVPGEEQDLIFRIDDKNLPCTLRNDGTDGRLRICGILPEEISASRDTVFTKLARGVFELEAKEAEETGVTRETLRQIGRRIEAKGFTYPDGLVENFYLSLKSKPFVLLAGISGTGKTRFTRLFAEAMGATEDNGRYLLVPVRPDWSDPTDLLGRTDINGRFVPGVLLDFLKAAEADPEEPYFLCLDEMNLARVEYYFSNFLSALETREKKDGRIVTDQLLSMQTYGSDREAAEKYGRVYWSDNLYIVGTVNMDESTFPFSRRVLDRANTVEFSSVRLNRLPPLLTETEAPQTLHNDFLRAPYLLLKDCLSEDARFQTLCDRLEAINCILEKAGAAVGYRVRDEIVFYLLNNKKDGLLSEEEAFDNAIMQKLLPRIEGSGAAIGRMLPELFRFAAGEFSDAEGRTVSEEMERRLRTGAKAKYPKSAKKILYMMRRWEEDGYTSFWL